MYKFVVSIVTADGIRCWVNNMHSDDWYFTHWGRVAHICVSKLIIIGSDTGLSPGLRQAIIWTNAGILSIGPLGTNFSQIVLDIQTFSFKEMHLRMSSGKWRQFCLCLNEASDRIPDSTILWSEKVLYTVIKWQRHWGCNTTTGILKIIFSINFPEIKFWWFDSWLYPIVTFAYNYRIHSLREQLNTVESRYVFIPFSCWHLHVHPNSSTLAIYKFTHTNPEVTNERLHVERSVWDVWTSGKTPQNCPVQLLNLADPRKWAGPNTDLDSPCRFWLVSARKPGIEMCLLYP